MFLRKVPYAIHIPTIGLRLRFTEENRPWGVSYKNLLLAAIPKQVISSPTSRCYHQQATLSQQAASNGPQIRYLHNSDDFLILTDTKSVIQPFAAKKQTFYANNVPHVR
ncbi:hypothetical protein [Paenibacillus sp. ISL-20]|uniref:hypothetical protein n=1 Tax=Paenibacillus sp. ISL-20 TaxID=2819163 RepID=UPI001BE6AAE6|nr:hypothetical protein [Paenibacillus sp. ISL-20]